MLLIVNLLMLYKDLPTLFGPRGYIPKDVFQQRERRKFCVFAWLPQTDSSLYLVWSISLVASLGLLVGFYTRTSALIVFLTMISFTHRNQYVWHGGDNLQRIINFLLIFSHAGESLSIDAMLGGRHLLDVSVTADPWAWRLMQVQISVLYLRSVFWKMKGNLWRSGKAVWYPIHQDELSRSRVPDVLLHPVAIAFVTWSVMAAQLSVGTGVWIQEAVYPVLLVGIGMHLMLDLFLNLQLFSWTMICTYLLFVRPDDLNQIVRSIG